jgi:phospholipase/carboxylesterase
MTDLSLTHRTHPARAGAPPHPGLVLLHGLGSNELDLLSMAPAIDPRAYIISARAPLSYRWGGYMWYDLEQHGPGLGSESIESALQLLERFLTEVIEAYPIDPERLYVGGFSMGAAMAGALGLLYPERAAGAIMVSGYLPPDGQGRYRMEAAVGHPYFQTHGTNDPVVSIDYARQTRDFLLQTPVDLTYREYPIGHEVSLPELQDLAAWFSRVLDSRPSETPGR